MKYLNVYSIFVVTTIILLFSILSQSNLLWLNKNENSVNQDAITYLKTLKKGVITSSKITFESKQKIIELDIAKGTIPGTTILYGGKMQLKNDKNYKTTMYFGTKPNQLTIFIPSGSTYKKGILSDIKTGDTILLERIFRYNVSGENSIDLLLTKITKINK